jgi:hypothetical protein
MRAFLYITLGALLLEGCAGGVHPAANADHPRAEAVLNRENSRDASAALREGISLYNNGDFTGAIVKLSAPEIQAADASIRTSALKYTAFSYCVTQRPVPCRQAFDKALRIDAGFTLAAGEAGHPMWGPVFEKARASR